MLQVVAISLNYQVELGSSSIAFQYVEDNVYQDNVYQDLMYIRT